MVLLDENKNSLTIVKDHFHTAQRMVPLVLTEKDVKHNKVPTTQRPDFYLKLIVLGDAGVGKTSLSQSYRSHNCLKSQPWNGKRTRSTEYLDSITQRSGKTIFIRLYDTAGNYNWPF